MSNHRNRTSARITTNQAKNPEPGTGIIIAAGAIFIC